MTGEVYWYVLESSIMGGSVLAKCFISGDLSPDDLIYEFLRRGECGTIADLMDFWREPLVLGDSAWADTTWGASVS